MNISVNVCNIAEFKRSFNQESLSDEYYASPAGVLKITRTKDGIHCAQFVEEHTDTYHMNTLPLLLVGTPFQIKVWQALLQIPAGTTISYQQLAHTIGYPRSWRAVANAVGQNNIAYFIPCHRVIRKNGKIGGYRWGIAKKLALLKAEGIIL